MHEIIAEVKSAAQKEHDHITDQSVEAVTPEYQCNRKFDILRIKDRTELTVHISDIHVQKGIESYRITEKNIYQQSAEKANQKSCLFTAHKSERGCQNNQQIRYNAAERQCVKYGAL